MMTEIEAVSETTLNRYLVFPFPESGVICLAINDSHNDYFLSERKGKFCQRLDFVLVPLFARLTIAAVVVILTLAFD